jgi:hypothetical protein
MMYPIFRPPKLSEGVQPIPQAAKVWIMSYLNLRREAQGWDEKNLITATKNHFSRVRDYVRAKAKANANGKK